MAYLSGSEIKAEAIEIIRQHPEGIRPTALLKIIQQRHPETKDGAIRVAVRKLDQDFPEIVGKDERWYFLRKYDARSAMAAPKPAKLKTEKAPRKVAAPKREGEGENRVTH